MQSPKTDRPRWARSSIALTLAWLALSVAADAQQLVNPRRLVEGPSGHLLVSDRVGTIVAVDKTTLQPTWSYQLPNEGAPFGLAIWNRLVFVGNTSTASVQVYRLEGALPQHATLRLVYDLGAAGGSTTISKPIGIAVDRKEQLVFVLDGAAKSIEIYDRRGEPVGSFAPVDGSGAVLSPVALAVDENRRELLVSDYGDPSGSFRPRSAARILIYDYDGSLLFQINGDRTTHWSTSFARLQGLAASADGRIFAADPLGGRVLVLDRVSGALLEELGEQGSQPGELMLPLDLVLDQRTGDLFVTNNQGARRVEALRGAAR